MSLQKHLNNLKSNGITVIKNVFSKKKCEDYKRRSELLFSKLLKKRKANTYNNFTQIINSPFQYDNFFFQQVYFSKIDKILTKLLDRNYVLINTNLINHKIFSHPNIKNLYSKNKRVPSPLYNSEWHTDSRYLGGKRVGRGLSYIVTIPLDDFNLENGTRYIPKSHHSDKIPKRNANYKHKVLTPKKGDLVIFDSGLWHKAGNATIKGRWSIFNYYGPWWMKPYFMYDQMLGKRKINKLSVNIKRMLHFYSSPPKNDHIRTHTVVKY